MAILNFADLKKSGNDLSRLNEEASKLKGGKFERDDRYWYPELDKAGEGSAVIRFLPAPAGEDVPFVRKFSYWFKGPTGKWFVENSPETIGLPCPVREFTGSLWATGLEEKKDEAKKYKRRMGFISNIYVVKHKARPEDEGKVFLYEYPGKVWNKLNNKMCPDDEGRKSMNPFDLWEGANFFLKIKNVANFRNYDSSEFDDVGPLASDTEMEKIWRQCYSLQEEIGPDKFKSYDELKAKLESVLSGGSFSHREEDTSRSYRKDPGDEDKVPFDTSPTDPSDDLAWIRELASKN